MMNDAVVDVCVGAASFPAFSLGIATENEVHTLWRAWPLQSAAQLAEESGDTVVSTVPGQGHPEVGPEGQATGQGGRRLDFLPFLETGG